MPLLADYAITPDVFDSTSYSSGEACGLGLNIIREVMMEEGLVRDLRAGEWRDLFSNRGRAWHRRAREIVRKLATQGRLIDIPAEQPATPADDLEWCAEALAGHRRKPLVGGVIVTGTVKESYRNEPLVEQIDRLSRAPWWGQRSSSVQLDRKLADYRQHLNPILRCANSIQFIDPHLNPSRTGYQRFPDLLADAGRRRPSPLIEIHRVCYEGSGRNRQLLGKDEIERIFHTALAGTLRVANLGAQVFIWDDFHDRYLISNLIGVSLPNGFDTSNRPNDMTTWARLGRANRDDIQREFDVASERHTLRHRFTLP